jgi:hypothetical protein
VHQVGPKDSGSQNFSFLALKAEAVGEVQILRTATAAATARDRRKKKYCFNHVIRAHFLKMGSIEFVLPSVHLLFLSRYNT